MIPAAVRQAGEDVEIDVQVVPRASRSRVVGVHGDRIKIQLTAPPVDGAANAALVELVASLVERPRQAVELRQGTSSKRKTLRIRDIDAPTVCRRLGLLAVALLTATAVAACDPITTTVEIGMVLPEDQSRVAATDNVSVVLSPDGFTETVATAGLDFALAFELEPDSTPRTLSIYLAQGETLLAWGRSTSFTWATAAGLGMQVFVGHPGTLSTFPQRFDTPDPGTLAAYAFGWGLVALAGDGTTAFLEEPTLELRPAARLSSSRGLPDPGDGALVSDALGGVQRLAWNEGLSGHRYDPASDTWIELALSGSSEAGAREGAAHLVDVAGTTLLLFGGATHTDVVGVRLVPVDGQPDVAIVDDWALDGPRRGATAVHATRSETDEGETPLLVGGDDPALPLVYAVQTGEAAGPPGAWSNAACLLLDAKGAESTLQVLCVGGTRDDAPTPDAVLVSVGPVADGTPLAVEVLPDFLPAAMADPLLLADETAVYAQGAGRWVRIARTDLAVTEPQATPLRTSGGASVTMSTGATFLVGGVDDNGAAVDRWQVFIPDLPPS